MKICVRVHDLGKDEAINLAQKANEIGFSGVQLVLNKAIIGESGEAGTLSKEKANQIRDDFNKYNIDIAMLGAYFNPVHSNKDKVKASIDKFKEHLKYAKDFNCKYVGTETGSFNDDKWTYNPLNRTNEAFLEVENIFKKLAAYAKENNSYMAIEGAYGHCMYEPIMLKKLYDNINNGHVNIIVDVFNYLYIGNYMNQREIFDECIKLFDDKIVIFHLKDFIVEDGALKQVGLGQGLMDFDYMLPIIKKKCPNAYLVFEGVKKEDMVSSYNYILNKLK